MSSESRLDRYERQDILEEIIRPSFGDSSKVVSSLFLSMQPKEREGVVALLTNGTDPAKARSLTVLTDAEMEARPAPEWLVEGWIPSGSLAVFVGPPGSGKGFVVLDVAYHIALGRHWQGRGVKPGPVVYLAAERAGSLGVRSRAWKTYHGLPGSAPVFFIPQRVSLFDTLGAAAVVQALKSLESPPVLLIVDTLAKTILPGDENSTPDMGTFLLNVQRIREEVGSAVALVHHMNASGERERGNTSLRGDADTLISIKQEDGVVQMRCEKMNDAEEPEPIALQIVSSGDSAICIRCHEGLAVTGSGLSSNERQTLASLPTCFPDAIATSSQWETASGIPPRSFYRARTSLVERGYVHLDKPGRGGRYSLTSEGAKALTAKLPTHCQSLPGSNPQSLPATGGALEKPPVGSEGSAVREEEDDYDRMEREAIQAEGTP